jgi:hypothetical protein
MMRHFALSIPLLMSFVTLQASAESTQPVVPYKVVAEAKMTRLLSEDHSHLNIGPSFQGVKQATLEALTTSDGKAIEAFRITYKQQAPGVPWPRNPQDVSYLLKVNEKSHADGSEKVMYFSNLEHPVPSIQARFSVALTQYGNEFWVANVRKGYGFCGAGDETMTLAGYPRFKASSEVR